MDVMPGLDPIRLPAPVWPFQLLHTLTLARHFGAAHLLVGGFYCHAVVLHPATARRSRAGGCREGYRASPAGSHGLCGKPERTATAFRAGSLWPWPPDSTMPGAMR